jgi:hypothetical protein
MPYSAGSTGLATSDVKMSPRGTCRGGSATVGRGILCVGGVEGWGRATKAEGHWGGFAEIACSNSLCREALGLAAMATRDPQIVLVALLGRGLVTC